MSTVGGAYSRTGAAWQRGPGLIYDRLAEELVSCASHPLRDQLAIDLGAGTGAATRALIARGARVVAVDSAVGMLQAFDPRPPSIAGDALALPLRDACIDVVVAAFSLNHLVDPVAGLRETARVTRPGGLVLGSAYAENDTHPAKQAAENAATQYGWSVPAWYAAVRADAVPKLATAERAATAVTASGYEVLIAEERRVPFPDLGPRELIEWRLGMAQLAPFVATLPPTDRAALVDAAVHSLQGAPPLVRSIVVFVGRVSAGAAD